MENCGAKVEEGESGGDDHSKNDCSTGNCCLINEKDRLNHNGQSADSVQYFDSDGDEVTAMHVSGALPGRSVNFLLCSMVWHYNILCFIGSTKMVNKLF